MPADPVERFHVVTGGPGSGKTTLIEALAAAGLAHMPEGGRAIIRAQQAIEGKALPWRDRAAFADQMLGWELRSHAEAGALAGPVLFDRALPDVVGYLKLCGLAVPPPVLRACHRFRYAANVFVAPPWPAIFVQDGERKQDMAEAMATYDRMIDVYVELGYTPVTLPLASVADRVRFVRARIG